MFCGVEEEYIGPVKYKETSTQIYVISSENNRSYKIGLLLKIRTSGEMGHLSAAHPYSPKLIRDGETRSWWSLGSLFGFSLWTLTAAIEGSNRLVSKVCFTTLFLCLWVFSFKIFVLCLYHSFKHSDCGFGFAILLLLGKMRLRVSEKEFHWCKILKAPCFYDIKMCCFIQYLHKSIDKE